MNVMVWTSNQLMYQRHIEQGATKLEAHFAVILNTLDFIDAYVLPEIEE